MAGNSFGDKYRITTFGESHGGAVGVVVDGCPPGLAIQESDIQVELDRRKPGQSHITTPRKEEDTIKILSGVFQGVTTGTPILIIAHNKDVKSEDYNHLKDLYRPSHADYTYIAKYGLRDWRGSGRASARETLARVAGGAIALKYLREKYKIEILSFVEQVGDIKTDFDSASITKKLIDSNIVRCPDGKIAKEMISLIEKTGKEGDSIGGIIKCIVRSVPVGLGEPVFDRLHADLGKAMLSINAVKGFEIGDGFRSVGLKGSQHNDEFYIHDGKPRTKTNHAGGVLGGISNGEDIIFRVAFKPVATISKKQRTINTRNEEVDLEAFGRHDPCVLPRAVPIVDAMCALVLIDHALKQFGK